MSDGDELSRQFWRTIQTMTTETTGSLMPVRVNLVEDRDFEVDITRYDDEEDEIETHIRVRGFGLVPGQDTYALPLGNDELLILGQINPEEEANPHFINGELEIHGNLDVLTPGNIVVQSGYVGASNFLGGDAQFEDVEAASLQSPVNNLVPDRFIRTRTIAQSSANTASNASTVSYVEAVSATITIPANSGTWEIDAIGGIALQNASGNVTWFLEIDLVQGTTRTLNATTEQQFIDNATVSVNSTGSDQAINVSLHYKPTSAGTANARNPWLVAIAKRTTLTV